MYKNVNEIHKYTINGNVKNHIAVYYSAVILQRAASVYSTRAFTSKSS